MDNTEWSQSLEVIHQQTERSVKLWNSQHMSDVRSEIILYWTVVVDKKKIYYETGTLDIISQTEAERRWYEAMENPEVIGIVPGFGRTIYEYKGEATPVTPEEGVIELTAKQRDQLIEQFKEMMREIANKEQSLGWTLVNKYGY